MPNLPAHIELAEQAARRLSHPTLERHIGYFLLGSTSPDIRVITRRRREEYHFAPLDFEAVGAGVRGLFHSHPHLDSSSDHDGPTQAFMAGYITHLIADEIWIVKMFRPYFGNSQVFQDEVSGMVFDRALQLELDRQSWQTAVACRPRLGATTDGIEIGFIPSATLADWREWVVSAIDGGFTWDRLRFMARRIALGDDAHPAHRVADDFIRDMPDSLEDLYELVPRSNLLDFKEQTVDELVRAVGDYLP